MCSLFMLTRLYGYRMCVCHFITAFMLKVVCDFYIWYDDRKSLGVKETKVPVSYGWCIYSLFVRLFKSRLRFVPMVLLGSRGSEVRTGSVGLDGRPTPAWLTPHTLNWYVVFSFRPVTGYRHGFCMTSLQRSHFPTPISHLPETEERHTWHCYKTPWSHSGLPGNHLQHSKNTIATSPAPFLTKQTCPKNV